MVINCSPLTIEKPASAQGKFGIIDVTEQWPHRVDTAHDVVTPKPSFRAVPNHFRHDARIVEEVVEGERDVRPMKSLLAGDVETAAVKDLEQAGQRLGQLLGRCNLRIGRNVVIDDSDVGASAGDPVVVVCRPKVDDDLDARIPDAFKGIPQEAPTSERLASYTPPKDRMQVLNA